METLRTKIFLLVIDKIVIGALISVALFLYDDYNKREIRTYNESRETIQLNFKRAEYLNQFLPVILDQEKNIFQRVHALSALVNTASVDSVSAIEFAHQILLSDKDKTLHDQESILSRTILDMLPDGLQSAVQQYDKIRRSAEFHKEDEHAWSIVLFWRFAILDTLKRDNVHKLNAISSDELFLHNLIALYPLISSLDKYELGQIDHVDTPVIRILAAIARLKMTADHHMQDTEMNPETAPFQYDSTTIEYLLQFVEPHPERPNASHVAQHVVTWLNRLPVASTDFALRLHSLIQQPNITDALRKHHPFLPYDEGVAAIADWNNAAVEYLIWASRDPVTSAMVVEKSEPVVNQAYKLLHETSVDQINRTLLGKYERVFLRLLITAHFRFREEAKESIEVLLSQLFGLEPEKLKAADLLWMAELWEDRNRDIVCLDKFGFRVDCRKTSHE